MAEAISLVAAVLGIADVTTRLAKAILGTISKLKNPSTEIQSVRDKINELTNTLQQIQHLGQSYSQLPLDDGSNSSFEDINQILASCQGDLLKLRTRLSEVDRMNDSWFGRTVRRVKFAQYEKEISKTCQRLETHKTSLLVCLSTVGRFHDLTIHRRTLDIHRTIEEVREHVTTGNGISTEDPSDTRIHLNRCPIVDPELIDPHLDEYLSRQDELRATRADRGFVADPESSHIASVEQRFRTNLDNFAADTNRRFQSLQDDIRGIQIRLNQLNFSMPNGDGFVTEIFNGSAVQMSTALGLLHSHLSEAIAAIARHEYGMSTSRQDREWLKKQFESLLADASHLAARELTHHSSRPRPKHLWRPSQPLLVQRTFLRAKESSNHVCSASGGLARSRKRKTPMTDERIIQLDLSVGKLNLYLTEEPFGSGNRGTGRVCGARILFFPHPGLCIYGLAASAAVGLPRMLSTFGVHPNSAPIFSHIENRDINEIQQLLALGKVRPTDRDEDGESLLWYAVRYFDYRICNLLLREGADPLDCDRNGGSALACFIEENWARHSDPKGDLNIPGNEVEIMTGTRLFVEFCGANSVRMTDHYTDDGFRAGQSPISMLALAVAWIGSPTPQSLNAIQFLINQAIEAGVDLEERNLFGLTPLMSVTRNVHLSNFVPVTRMFLQAGANPRQVENDGCGLLHHIARQLSACNNYEMSAGDASQVTDLVATLITQYGCDPLLRDQSGSTPYDEALSPVAWVLWCDAMVQAGHDIETDLRTQDLRNCVSHSRAQLDRKYKAVMDGLLVDRGQIFIENAQDDQVPCTMCGKSDNWQKRRQPFDCLGSYLVNINEEWAQHTYAYNHRGGVYCDNIRAPGTCRSRQHAHGETYIGRSHSQLSWRKHIAFRLWRDRKLITPLDAQLWISGFLE